MSESIEIRLITKEHEADINIKNEPFTLFGRMIPDYMGEEWGYTTEIFDETFEMTFPDENYSFDELSKNSFFIGAYINDKCVGLAIVQQAFFKYLYLYDLKVDKASRGLGIARLLIEKAQEIAAEEGYIGVYTQAQDNNLGACLFYLHAGFQIGGLDTNVYKGTPQADKKDIYFYLDNH